MSGLRNYRAYARTAKLTPPGKNRSTGREAINRAKSDQSAPAFFPSASAAWRSIWRTKGTHLPHSGWQPQAPETIETEQFPPAMWGETLLSVSALHRHTYMARSRRLATDCNIA